MALSAENGMAYRVVVNAEDQHALWFADRELPAGWQETGASGSRDECLRYVRENWTDLRPRSLRERMDTATNGARAHGD